MARAGKNPNPDQSSTTGMTWSDLIRWTLVNISWKLVGAGIVLSLLLIPILYLYRTIFPELFRPRAPTYNDEVVLLPASQLWMWTGIQVEAGEEIQLRASGGVNLATHRSVFNALSDTEPSLPWMFLSGPTRVDSIGPRPANPDDSLIHPSAPDGALLLFVRPLNSSPSSDNPRPSNKPNDDYFVVAPRSPNEWITLKAPRSGELCFVVNDVVADEERFYVVNDPKTYVGRVKTLNEVSKLFREKGLETPQLSTEMSREVGEYLGRFIGQPPMTPEAYVARKKEAWQRLHDSGYKRIFHDDNSGSYLITVRKRAI
jgi:hypothetical protein